MMMALRQTLSLLVICGALGVWVYLQWTAVGQGDPEVAGAEPQAVKGESLPMPPQPPLMPPLSSYAEIVERPLFNETRRPPPAPETPVVAAQINPTQFRLEGTALTAKQRVAVLRDTRTNQLHRLAEGDQLDGWQVSSVQAGTIALSQGAQTLQLELERPTQGQNR